MDRQDLETLAIENGASDTDMISCAVRTAQAALAENEVDDVFVCELRQTALQQAIQSFNGPVCQITSEILDRAKAFVDFVFHGGNNAAGEP